MGGVDSTIAWMTGGLRERDAALHLLRGVENGEPRDEFGIASLRDVLSNAFFPGVTTIQTRAKYFLWVPAIYVTLERHRPRDARISNAVRERETELMNGLRAAGESEGVIGSRSWKLPQRSAADLYWHGTRTWGLRSFSNPQADYHRWLSSSRRAKPAALADEEGQHQTWNGWFYEQDSLLADHRMQLSDEQGSFLGRRIETITDAPHRCLLKDLLETDLPHGTPFWDLPKVESGRAALSPLAGHAKLLSAAIDGAVRAYGALWATRRDDLDTEPYVKSFEDWAQTHPGVWWSEWDLDEFWALIRELPWGTIAQSRTRPFIECLVREYQRQAEPALSQRLEQEIVRRERQVKPGRARLSGGSSLVDREPPDAGGLGFRWWQARRMLLDIRNREDG